MNDENPYAPPAAERDDAPADDAENNEAHDERLRWESTEGHVSAIGLVAYSPVLLYAFIIAVLLRTPVDAPKRRSLLIGAVVVGLLVAFGAYRLRKLRRDGRLILTGFFLLTLVYLLFVPFNAVAVAIFVPPAIAVFYLWLGPGAHVLGEQHAKVLGVTRGRAVPTATWGFVVFGLFAAGLLFTALNVVARSG